MTTRELVPVGDLIDHERGEDCVCGPQVRPVERPDGSIGWVLVHHSLDGREMKRHEPENKRRRPRDK